VKQILLVSMAFSVNDAHMLSLYTELDTVTLLSSFGERPVQLLLHSTT